MNRTCTPPTACAKAGDCGGDDACSCALDIGGDAATARGRVAVDRRAFGMGESYPDEKTVGFDVVIAVELSALRTKPADGS